MKKAIIIIVSVLVLLGGTFAGLFFFTDIFDFLKPSNETFVSQAKKLMGMTEKEESSYSNYIESIESFKIQDSSYTANTEISMNLDLNLDPTTSSEEGMTVEEFEEILNSSSIKLSESYDSESKAMSTNVALSNNNEDIISLSALLKDQSINVSSSQLYDKSLTFDLTKLETFLQQNNISYDADTLKLIINSMNTTESTVSPDAIYDLLYISEDDYNSLKDNYENLLTDVIDEENYTTEKNKKVSVNGEEVKTTAYSLTLTGEDAYNSLTELVNKIEEDDTLKDLIVNKYSDVKDLTSSVSNLSEDIELEDLPDLTTSDLDSLTSSLSEALEQSEESFSEIDGCLRITIYSNKKNEPVKLEVIILDDEEDEEGSVIFTQELSEGKTVYTLDFEELTGEDDAGKLVLIDEYESTETSRKGKLTLTDNEENSLSMDYEMINSDSELKLYFSGSIEDSKLNFNMHLKDLDKETQNIELIYGAESEEYGKAEIKITGSITNGKSDIPEIASENSVDVFAMTQEEQKQLYADIVTNASNNLPEKLSKIGIDITKEEILTMFSLTQTTPETQPTTDPSTTPTIDPSTIPSQEEIQQQIQDIQQQANDIQQQISQSQQAQ